MTAVARAQTLADLEQALAAPPDAGTGTPHVGTFCAYVPPELLLAAGVLPVRLRASGITDSSSGDAYLSHLTCSFARHLAAGLVDGAFDHLAGVVAANTCDHMRRVNDVLVAKTRIAFRGYVAVPRHFRDDVVPWFTEELQRLAIALEQHFGVAVTEERLDEAGRRIAAVRAALARLDALRRADPPRLRGSDVLVAGIAARTLSPERFVLLADALAAAAADAPPISGIRARVVLTGGSLDDPAFVRTLESQGAHVAADQLCWGARGLGGGPQAGARPGTLEALARAVLHQEPCARMMGEFPGRYASLRELVRASGAEGIVFQRLKFCQIWSSDVHNLRHRLAADPFPLLVIDRELGVASVGQIKTRIQGFVERLGAQRS